GEAGEPCGMPFTTGSISSRIPSKQTAALLSDTNDRVHFTIARGSLNSRIVRRSRAWLTLSKKPLMSK
ncbi:hypothetical protein C8Q80DRAFT_1073631, partial [Daedaleopsis nitida]